VLIAVAGAAFLVVVVEQTNAAFLDDLRAHPEEDR
jgi:hypothetical protein